MREKIFYVIIENISVIGDDAFARFSNILNVTFSDSFLKVIKQNAFIGCSIKSITFPSSIEFIGDSAFSECSILDLVTFPEQSKLTSISSNTFSQCSNLKSISIPSTTQYMIVHFIIVQNFKIYHLKKNQILKKLMVIHFINV